MTTTKTRTLRRIAIVALIAFLLLLGILAVLFLFVNPWTTDIRLSGESTVTLEYGTAYTESGAEAVSRSPWIFRGGKSMGVTVSGQVGTAPGDYTVTYTAGPWGNRVTAVRQVRVRDTVSPEITLLGERDMALLTREEYSEPGFSAADNVDGDITDRVSVTEEADSILYSVSDSSGNTAEVRRNLHEAAEPPVLTLLGDESIEMNATVLPFSDPGCSAYDRWDGDLTESVVVTGFVNPHRAGDYTLSYSVTDSSGQTATAERRIHVSAVPRAEVSYPDGQVIYLTFDDGPSENTEHLLEILARYEIKATWFVTDTHPGYRDEMDKIAEAGHVVAVHTASHDYNTIYASEDAYFADFRQIQDIVFEKTGKCTTLFRFPGGSSNTVSSFCPGIMSELAQSAEDCGLTYFDWNVSAGDSDSRATRYTVLENLKEGVQEHRVSVVLQHDTRRFSIDALEDFIPWALEAGYTFLTIDETSPTMHHEIAN